MLWQPPQEVQQLWRQQLLGCRAPPPSVQRQRQLPDGEVQLQPPQRALLLQAPEEAAVRQQVRRQGQRPARLRQLEVRLEFLIGSSRPALVLQLLARH